MWLIALFIPFWPREISVYLSPCIPPDHLAKSLHFGGFPFPQLKDTGPVGIRGVSFSFSAGFNVRIGDFVSFVGKSFIPKLLDGHSVVGALRYKIARKIPETSSLRKLTLLRSLSINDLAGKGEHPVACLSEGT